MLKFWCLFFAALKFIWGKGLGSHIRISWYENQMSDLRLETGTRGNLVFTLARGLGQILRGQVHRSNSQETGHAQNLIQGVMGGAQEHLALLLLTSKVPAGWKAFAGHPK